MLPSQQPPQQNQGSFSPVTPFTPEQYDSALVHLSRAKALEAITLSKSMADGGQLAWEACISFAETLFPLASNDFLRAYLVLRKAASFLPTYPSRALWRICSMEMRQQKRLGKENIPLDRAMFGIEPE